MKYVFLCKVYNRNGKIYVWFSVKQLFFFENQTFTKKICENFLVTLKESSQCNWSRTDIQTGEERGVWVEDTDRQQSGFPFFVVKEGRIMHKDNLTFCAMSNDGLDLLQWC